MLIFVLFDRIQNNSGYSLFIQHFGTNRNFGSYLMMLLQAPHSGVRLLAANLSALWATPLATGRKGAGLGVMGAGLGAAGPAWEGLGMYAGAGGADWGSGCTFMWVVVLLGSNLSAKLVSDTQGGLLALAGAPGGGAGAEAGGWG